MCPSHFRRIKVTSPSSQSHIKNFQVESESIQDLVESESSHKNCEVTSSCWFASSSQCRVKWNITFFRCLFFAMKWHPTCYKMAPEKLQDSAQCYFSKFDWRFFIYNFLWKKKQFERYLSLSLSVISTSFASLLQKINLSVFRMLHKWKWPETNVSLNWT